MEIWCRSSDALFRRSRHVRLWALADITERGGDTLRRRGSEGEEKREFLIVF
jgi:hypothetical protein